jgi:four helix bundle protein
MVTNVTELQVYQAAYALAMDLFVVSRCFPPEERFALTSQMRRASRSVSRNPGEAWAKRHYEAHFISKLTDCDGENAETETCLDFALDCGYITREQHGKFVATNREIGRLPGAMIRNPAKWILSPAPRAP